MVPTIRIDEEVYAWLQQNARPFEDTPNSVLRRIAGLETPGTEKSMEQKGGTRGIMESPQLSQESPARIRAASTMGRGRMGLDGKQLNDKWKVGARHALFSRDGAWYENLERFPGALFDPQGYVLFKTEQEYRNNPYIRVGKKTNVRGGISSIPGYVRKV